MRSVSVAATVAVAALHVVLHVTGQITGTWSVTTNTAEGFYLHSDLSGTITSGNVHPIRDHHLAFLHCLVDMN
jgi:hypothetical protein